MIDNNVEEIIKMINIVYSSSPSSQVSQIESANKYLSSLIHINNFSFFRVLLTNNEPKIMFYASSALSRLVRENFSSISKEQSQKIIEYITQFIISNASLIHTENKYLIKSLSSTLAMIIRMTMYNTQPLIINYINNALITYKDVDILITSLDVLSEIVSSFKSKALPPIDKIARIICEYEKGIEKIVMNHCIEVLGKIKDIYQTEVILAVINVLEKIGNEDEEDNKKKDKSAIMPIYLNGNEEKRIRFDIDKACVIYKEMIELFKSTKREEWLRALWVILKIIIGSNNKIYIEGISKGISEIIKEVNGSVVASKIVYEISKASSSDDFVNFYYNNILKVYIINSLEGKKETLINTYLDIIVNINKSLSITTKIIKEDSFIISYLSSVLSSIEIQLSSIPTGSNISEIIDSNLLTEFIKSFSTLSTLVPLSILPLLFTANTNTNQHSVFLRMDISISLLKKLNNPSPPANYFQMITESINLLLSQIKAISLSPITTYHFLSIFIQFLSSKNEQVIQSANQIAQHLQVSSSSDLVVSVINFIIDLSLTSSYNSLSLPLLSKTSKLLTLFKGKLYSSFNPNTRTFSYFIGNIQINTPQLLQTVNTLITKVNSLIISAQSINETIDKCLLSINTNLFAINLLITQSNECNGMNIIDDFFSSLTISNITSHANLMNVLALIRAISMKKEYIIFISKFSVIMENIVEEVMDGKCSLDFFLKISISISDYKKNMISFPLEYPSFPNRFLSLISSLINSPFIQKNQNFCFIFKFTKILSNIAINKRLFEIAPSSTNETMIIEIWNKINTIIDTNFSLDDLIGYNKKMHNIFKVIKFIFALSPSENTQIFFSEKIAKLFFENSDSLDNVILISTHETIFEMGKVLIESKTKFSQNVFNTYREIFVNTMIKIVNMISTGEITSLTQISNSLLVLVIIYESEFVTYITKEQNPKLKANYLKMTNGIGKNIYKNNLYSFKNNLINFIKEII